MNKAGAEDSAACRIGDRSFKGERPASCLHVASMESSTKSKASLVTCVEINQCVGCTRQFFTKSFLGDDAAVLAPSSGEEPITAPASRRRVDGVEDDTMIQHDRAVKF